MVHALSPDLARAGNPVRMLRHARLGLNCAKLVPPTFPNRHLTGASGTGENGADRLVTQGAIME